MTSRQSDSVLNDVLIELSRGFLQYVAESWPWVEEQSQAIGQQVDALAASQRQDVTCIVELLLLREWAIDFGSFPTEYTDLHFISLSSLLQWLNRSQAMICQRLSDAVPELKSLGDAEAAELIESIQTRQNDTTSALADLLRAISSGQPSA